MQFYQKLKKIQEISKKTQEQLADIFSVSYPTINSWINQRSQPRRKNQVQIDELYASYTGRESYSSQELKESRGRLKKQQAKCKSPLKILLSRKDLHDNFVLSLTYNSNSIEGSTFEEAEVRSVIFDQVTVPERSVLEHQEVKNHQAALNQALRWLSKGDAKISEEKIKRLHEILMNGVLPNAGQYRNHPVRILGSSVPTSNHLSITRDMSALLKKINRCPKNEAAAWLAKTHAEFERIHPFSDGNGRIGRLLLLLQTLNNAIAPALIRQERRQAYYSYLEKAQLEKHAQNLEIFIIEAILESYKILT